MMKNEQDNQNNQDNQKQADEKMLKEFAEAFWKLRWDYPDVRILGDSVGDVEAFIDRGLFSSNPKVYLIVQ